MLIILQRRSFNIFRGNFYFSDYASCPTRGQKPFWHRNPILQCLPQFVWTLFVFYVDTSWYGGHGINCSYSKKKGLKLYSFKPFFFWSHFESVIIFQPIAFWVAAILACYGNRQNYTINFSSNNPSQGVMHWASVATLIYPSIKGYIFFTVRTL